MSVRKVIDGAVSVISPVAVVVCLGVFSTIPSELIVSVVVMATVTFLDVATISSAVASILSIFLLVVKLAVSATFSVRLSTSTEVSPVV